MSEDGPSRSAASYFKPLAEESTSGAAAHRKNGLSPRNSFDSFASAGSFADPSMMEPVVPVAAAPKNDNLYETLVRYHNENDSSSDEEGDMGARRRRKKGAAAAGTAGYKSSDDSDLEGIDDRKMSSDDVSLDDRKMPAKPTVAGQRKSPPPPAATNTKMPPPPATSPKHSPIPTRKDFNESPLKKKAPVGIGAETDHSGGSHGSASPAKGSFYAAALESQRLQHEDPKRKSPKSAARMRPGVVHVNEPAIRSDSAMYRAAYGGPPSRPNAPSPFPAPLGIHDVRDTLATLQESRAVSRRQLVHETEERFDQAKKSLGNPRTRSRSPYARLQNLDAAQSEHNSSSSQMITSQSAHVPRGNPSGTKMRMAPPRQGSGEGGTKREVRNSGSGGGLTSMSAHSLSSHTSANRLAQPPANMMNIGNDDHMGLGVINNPPKEEKSRPRTPLGIFSRQSADKPTRHSSADKASRRKKVPMPPLSSISPDPSAFRKAEAKPGPSLPAPSYPRVGYSGGEGDALGGLSTHSSLTHKEYNERRGQKNEPSLYQRLSGFGSNPPKDTSPTGMNSTSPQDVPSSVPSLPETEFRAPQPGLVSTESMDEELRLALEISKRDTGNATSRSSTAASTPALPVPKKRTSIAPPRRMPPKPGPTRAHQTSFGREAVAHAHQNQNSSISDLMLALKLSAEESGINGKETAGRSSTNLDELLAFEMSQENQQSMTDFVAAGISTTTAAAAASQPPDEQHLILERIREEQEQKELELALKASQADSSPFPSEVAVNIHGAGGQVPSNAMDHSNDFLLSQQQAMDEFTRGVGAGESKAHPPRDLGPRQSSTSSFDSEGRRKALLRRGTSETKNAIKSGNAHVVTCRGCGGRLQAPVSYSLVFCPKCQTISPA